MLRKILSLTLSLSLLFQYSGFAQSINLSDYLSRTPNAVALDRFRPLSLRYFSYEPSIDNFKILLDKGDQKDLSDAKINAEADRLLTYFKIGLSLPNEKFWVNLRPDAEDQIIDPELEKTDLGKALLEADLQLKKDTSSLTSPQSKEGKVYWEKLYKKAGELFGTENITIPTITRPWIVPGEIIVRESPNSAYVYKAVLKVMLEEDYLRGMKDDPAGASGRGTTVSNSFNDPRLKELNKYSTELIKEAILPELTKRINSSKDYANLRQVFFSLILARWFKDSFKGKKGEYSRLIDSHNLSNLTSRQAWSKTAYFNEYKKSFKDGEYNLSEKIYTPTGQSIRRYTSGGGNFIDLNPGVFKTAGSAINIEDGNKTLFNIEAGQLNIQKKAASAVIKTELKVPEGQPKGFFTNSYESYNITNLLKDELKMVPDEVVNTIRKKLEQDKTQGKILSATVNDFSGVEIDINTTHRYGELNAAVRRLMLEAIKEGILKAKELGLLKEAINIEAMSLEDLAKALRLKADERSITERGAEPVMIAKIIGASIGAGNIKLYHQFFKPGATPLQKLGFLPVVDLRKGEKLSVRGFRAIVKRTEDVLKGNFDGKTWEFEMSAECKVITKEGKEIVYPSKNQSLELLALAGQSNDYVITAVYPVEGSLLPSTEPVVTVVYQPVYGEKGNLRTLNPTFICRSQSGADAVAGVASMFYDVNFVPGGPNGEYFVATRPVTLKEARIVPKEGTANVVVYGWQSKGNGNIPAEEGGVIDHVGMNPEALGYDRKLADQLASVMKTHQYDQPYLAPFASEAQVESLREEQSHLFTRAPKEADIDSFMDEVEAKVVNGEYVAVNDDKADMGGKLGHNFTPEYMLAIDRATLMEAQEKGMSSDGNIIGFTDKGRLKGTTMSIGDDSHLLTLGDKTRNSATSHQLSFLAFTRGYLASMVGSTKEFIPGPTFDESKAEKPYGRAQDYQGKEAKAAKKHPYFYSHFTPRFFEILREIMPLDYMQMVDNMEKGWKHWQETKQETAITVEPFSGNVSQQGIGSARYLVDVAGGERSFGVLAGDKMGPAAFNRPIREGVYAALAAGEFKNGLVFEIWDAKSFDKHGNIPLDELPELFADVAESIISLKDQDDQDFVRECYGEDGLLKKDLMSLKDERETLAKLLKKAGYVPSKRIFLDAQKDKEVIYLYLADSDRFNIKHVWSKKKAGWDITSPKDYLEKPMLGSSVTKLGILAGGEYVGKDDPVAIGSRKLMEHIFAFLEKNPLIIQGDMNGSHWLAALPTAFKYAVANKESHPILVGFKCNLSDDGKTFVNAEDVFNSKVARVFRQKIFEFNHKFKQAQLGGQFEPYGTNWRTVEAAYPLAKLLNSLNAEDSPFLVKNKPASERGTRPTGIGKEIVELYKVATVSSSVDEAADSKDPETDAWIEKVRNYAWPASKVKYIEEQLKNMPNDALLQGDLKSYRKQLEILGNPNDSIPDALKEAIDQSKIIEPIVMANLKMNPLEEKNVIELIEKMANKIKTSPNLRGLKKDEIDIVIPVALPSIFIAKASEKIKELGLEGILVLGAQDVSLKSDTGAFTGEISAAMYKKAGVKYIIVGHSERRNNDDLQESSEQVNRKVKNILHEGLIPVICVGEKLEQREGGEAFKIIREQVLESTKGLTESQKQKIVIAYEPVWSIGTGVVATPEQAEEMHRFIRALLLNRDGRDVASKKSIIYGGSVKRGNAKSLTYKVNNGFLVGGASLTEEVIEIAEIVLEDHRAMVSSSLVKTGVEEITDLANSVGGIDLRQMNMLIQPQGGFASSSLDFSLPELSKVEIEAFDLDKELELIQRMASSGIDPIDERLKRYLAVCFARGRTGKEIDDLKLCLEDVFIAQQLDARKTPDGYKEVIVIADTRRFVVKESRLAASKGNIVNLN